jgi:hypothetical protein
MNRLGEIAKLINGSKEQANQFVHLVNNALRLRRTSSSKIVWALSSLPSKRRTLEEVVFTLEGKRSQYDHEINRRLADLENKGINITPDNIERKKDWQEFEKILSSFRIVRLYHFTDNRNWQSILEHNGLYSWYHCKMNDIEIPFPGGNELSRNLDRRQGVQDYVHLSFIHNPPMLDKAKQDKRIDKELILEVDPLLIYWETTKFSDMNATDNEVTIGDDLESFKKIKLCKI